MSDSLTRYCAIHKALLQLWPTRPTGRQACHLSTLALLVSGLIGSRRAHLPAIASHAPSRRSKAATATKNTVTKIQSRHKRLSRWLKNPQTTPETFFLPYALALIASLPPGPLVLVIDSTEVGRGCLALIISLVYQRRALPLCWSVTKAPEGHLPERTHIALVEKVASLIAPTRPVIFLGDGEFDGVGLLSVLEQQGWQFVCRTAKNVHLYDPDLYSNDVATQSAAARSWVSPAQVVHNEALGPGTVRALWPVLFTAKAYGPVLLAILWEEGYKEPLFLVSNLSSAEQAHSWYRRRFRIETFFSDQKSRGFCVHKSHLRDPERLSRLLIGTCLAYLWLVCLGAQVVCQGWLPQLLRPGGCDRSLFQIGLLWLGDCLDQGRPLRLQLRLPHALVEPPESVPS